MKSARSLITYIPDFLEYYKEEARLSPTSIENYSRFLDRFIAWLKWADLIRLTPQDLTSRHIQEYKRYLSNRISSRTQQHLKKTTQNCYLIAVRGLLSYLAKRGIYSLLSDEIKLSKIKKRMAALSELESCLNPSQLEKLVQAPDTSTIIGVRDKVILEFLFSTGLKVNELVKLNRDQIRLKTRVERAEINILNKAVSSRRVVYISEKATNWLRKYLTTRKDENKALFINYCGRNPKSRLTTRSIQRIVKKYVMKNRLSSLLTPEILRNAYVFSLLNQESAIKITSHPLTHKLQLVSRYEIANNRTSLTYKSKIKTLGSPFWHEIERVIKKEISWLKDNIATLPSAYKKDHPLINCDDCLLRKIAILIVSGRVSAIKFRTKNEDLWGGLTKQGFKRTSKHGKKWHREMMDTIAQYFKIQKYKVEPEPILSHGRADLGIYFKPNPKEIVYIVYVEVGTVSLFKLWYNLFTMKNGTFLIVPSEKYLIEFKILK